MSVAQVATAHASSSLPGHETFSQRWTSSIDTVRILICRSLQGIAHWSSTHPWTTVVSVVVFSVAMIAAGLWTNFTVEANGDVLWPPRGSTTQAFTDWISSDESNFSEELYFSTLYITVPIKGDNLLDDAQSSVTKVFEVLDAIRNLPDYAKICDQPYTINPETNVTASCDAFGVLEFWSSNTTLYQQQIHNDEQQAIIEAMSAARFPSGKLVDRARMYGTFLEDPNTTGLLLTHIEAYRLDLVYPISDEAFEFLTQVIQVAEEQNDMDDGYNVEIFTFRSFDDQFQQAIVNDIPLMPLAFIVMTIFCVIVFARRDKVRSQALLGSGAVWSVLFAIFTGYGIMFCAGVPLTSATQIVVFVMFGIGLDDAFIISGSYARTDPKKDPVERVADTMDDIGLSIAITTLTSALAFAIGCISSINAVYWLCLYAFPTIIIDFFYQITFFLALMVIDERRMQRNKMDCLVCITVNRDEEGEEEGKDPSGNHHECEEPHANRSHQLEEEEPTRSRSARFMNAYADVLFKPGVKLTVLVAFTALLGACIWGTTQFATRQLR